MRRRKRTPEQPREIRDLLYFDREKAASLYSQLAGGLPREMTLSSERGRDERNVRRYNLFGMFKPEFGGAQTSRETIAESRSVHHDLLLKIEQQLLRPGVGVDLNEALRGSEATALLVREAIEGHSYVRAEGWAVLEDYERMKTISSHFNEVARFIARCSIGDAQKTVEYLKLCEQFDEAKKTAAQEKDRNLRAKKRVGIEQLEKQFDAKVAEITDLNTVEDWLVDGMGMMIDVFMPGRMLFRLYPFVEVPDFQLLANLKRDCFIDADLDKVVFAYGSRPIIKLSAFGLITAAPTQEDPRFDPMTEFHEGEGFETSEEKGVEAGFRGLSNSYEGFDVFMRYSRYPNITIYPIAVYRRIVTNPVRED